MLFLRINRFAYTNAVTYDVFRLEDAGLNAFDGLIRVLLTLLIIAASTHQYIIALACYKRVFILGKILFLMDRSQAVKAIGGARIIPLLRGLGLMVFVILHEI